MASYYTGQDASIYVILLLTLDEDADSFEEGLAETARQVVFNVNSDSLKTILPSLFQRLSVYPSLNDEQKLGILYSSEIKRMTLKRLREEASLLKSEIAIWLKDQYKDGFVDTDNLTGSLIKLGLIRIASVKELSSDLVVLVEDIMMLRKPPPNLVKNPVERHLPESLKTSYLTEVKNFFINYRPNEEDNLAIIDKIILNPQAYEVLKLLREAIVTRNDIEKLRKKGVDDVEGTLKLFWENKMMAVFQDDKGSEYYALVSDFHIGKFYPRYLIDVIRTQYRNKVQNPMALTQALQLMKDEYYAMVQAKKAKPVDKNVPNRAVQSVSKAE